jgi:hypothetical protein
MRILFSSLAAVFTLTALPVHASVDIGRAKLPTPADLRNTVNYEIGQGGITPRAAAKLLHQADNLVQLEARYAADGYSSRERMEIKRRSLYLIQSVYFQRTGRTLSFDDARTSDSAFVTWAIPPGGTLNGPMPSRGFGQGQQR